MINYTGFEALPPTQIEGISADMCTAWCLNQHVSVALEPLAFIWASSIGALAVIVLYVIAHKHERAAGYIPLVAFFILAMQLLFIYWSVVK